MTQESTQATVDLASRSAGRARRLNGLPLFTAAILGIVLLGWLHRNDGSLRPDDGIGYAFGIAGAVMMLALLLYPLRKRVKAMRDWGRVADWFRWHMALGVLGPALIVVHSNWQLKSANAAVAFFAMLVVAGSGVVGRYLYGRIHAGLYGRRREAQELKANSAKDRLALDADFASEARIMAELDRFEAAALAPTTSFGSALARFLTVGALIRRSRRSLIAAAQRDARRGFASEPERRRRLKDARRRLDHYYGAVGRAATFGLYERLFALWHVLHVPLFVVLVCTAIVHVVAVNLY